MESRICRGKSPIRIGWKSWKRTARNKAVRLPEQVRFAGPALNVVVGTKTATLIPRLAEIGIFVEGATTTARVKGKKGLSQRSFIPRLTLEPTYRQIAVQMDATSPFAAIERPDVSDLGEPLSFFDAQMPN